MNEKSVQPNRYESFEGINCFENSRVVLKYALNILETPEYSNKFWDKFIEQIPESFYKGEDDEKHLYIVCSNVYYLEELFDLAEREDALNALEKCEEECC